MSGQQPPPYGNGPRGWNPRAQNPASPSPSTFLFRPPSPWTTAPSPPPIISGPRPFGHAMSPAPLNQVRGQRGSTNIPHPRPQWPGGNQSPAPFQQQQQPPPSGYYGGAGAGASPAPRPFRPAPLQHQNSYGAQPTSSFQLSPTPSPIVCQTPSSDFNYSNRQTPLYHPQQAPPPQYYQQGAPVIPPQPRQHGGHGLAQDQIDFVGVPLEPPQPKSYVIYDDEEEFGPSTAEIIANQSQDYIDEKLAEYQMTILQLQVAVVLMCAGSTRGEDQFTVTARQMMRIYGDPSVSKATKERNLDRLASFYQRNRQRIQFTPQERRQADDLLRRYNQAKASTVYVEGVPAQGGVVTSVLGSLALEATIQLAKFGVKHFSSSAGGVEINRGAAIFGLAFIIAFYLFRSKSL